MAASIGAASPCRFTRRLAGRYCLLVRDRVWPASTRRQAADNETDLSSIDPDVGQHSVVEALEVANRQSAVVPSPKPPERFQDPAED